MSHLALIYADPYVNIFHSFVILISYHLTFIVTMKPEFVVLGLSGWFQYTLSIRSQWTRTTAAL